MQPITATLITKNEEHNVADALRSVNWADEIVVVDSGSTDATVEICRTFTDRVYRRDWTGYVDQKNFAVDQSRNDWVVSIDADERLSPELVKQVAAWRRSPGDESGFRIPRVAFFMGRWIRHGDWYPDYQLRIFDRRRGRWQGGRVHESVRLNGRLGFFSGEIYHYTYHSLSDYLRRLDTYSTLSAADYRQKDRIAGLLPIMVNPWVSFLKSYLLKRGFLDGIPGLMVSTMGAVSVFFKYAKLYELQCRNCKVQGGASR